MPEEVLNQSVILFDPKKCSGCYYCMIVCSFYHFEEIDLKKAHLRVYQNETNPTTFINAHCTHCEHPFCVAACPTDPKAITKDDQGFVTIDKMRCIGCKSCNYACPISIPVFEEAAGISNKCNFCGGEPQCAKYCSTGALQVMSRGEAKDTRGAKL